MHAGMRLDRIQLFAFEDGIDRRAQRLIHAGSPVNGMHEGEARVDEHRRAVGLRRADGAARSGQRDAAEVLPGVAVVQQGVRLLSGNVDVDVPGRARRALSREYSTQLRTRSGYGQFHGIESSVRIADRRKGWVCGVSSAAQRRERVFRLVYTLISGVTEMPWSRTDAATVVSVIAISSLANASGKP